jgi:hypothetical protein
VNVRTISPDLIQTLNMRTGGGGCTDCASGRIAASPDMLVPRATGGLRALAPTTGVRVPAGVSVTDRLKNLNFDAIGRALGTNGSGGGGGATTSGGGGDGGGTDPTAKSGKLKKILIGGAILTVVVLGGIVLVKAATR